VPLDEQSRKALSDVLDAVIKKTTEELGHKFNKQQSIAIPALGTQFLEEVISLSSNLELCFSYCLHSLQHFFSKHYKIYLPFFFYCICFRLLGIIAPTILKRLR
jgi:hypothetical protein